MKVQDWRTWSVVLLGLFCGKNIQLSTSKISAFITYDDIDAPFGMDKTLVSLQEKHRLTYLELADEIDSITRHQTWIYKSSYDQATVVHKSAWFQPRRLCKETCCVETVAVSLRQDDTKIINWRSDHHDIADIVIHNYVTDEGISTFGTNFNESMIPCLVPGTIIAVDHFQESMEYFWYQVRPKIRVPYILITSGADFAAPFASPPMAEYISDTLLIQWYATNPQYNVRSKTFHSLRKQKFQPMLSGLSYLHPQHRYLTAYLELTNFTNPYEAKDWKSLANIKIDFDRDIFVHFGLRRQPYRRPIWKALCGNVNITDPTKVSCNQNTNSMPLHSIYQEMSQAKFGISPVGQGYDCYRVYELLLLGVVPVVFEKGEASRDLYEGLPMIHMPTMDRAKTREEYVEFIQEYIRSEKFQNASATFAQGWERLFVRHKRRRVLQKANRIKEIVRDSQGNEYYQGYKYTPDNAGNPIYCHNTVDNCALRKDAKRSAHWLKTEAGRQVDIEWIEKWDKLGSQTLIAME